MPLVTWPNDHITHRLDYYPQTDDDVLVIELRLPLLSNIGEIVRALMERQPWPKKILIVSSSEPSAGDYLEALDSIVTSLGIGDRVAIYDAGAATQVGNLKTFFYSTAWLRRFDEFKNVTPVPFNERSTVYCCLNRFPRPQRVRLVEELIKQDLFDLGLVTCGHANLNFHYHLIVDEKYLSYFPVTQLSSDESYPGDDALIHNPVPKVQNCLINLVSETSYGDIGFSKIWWGWERIMVTEKTTKAFLSDQLPIWLAPPYFVDYIRNLGFDTFDDIVCHDNYDKITDHKQRLLAVVEEFKKIATRPIQELQDLFQANAQRFAYNRQLVDELEVKLNLETAEAMKKWLAE